MGAVCCQVVRCTVLSLVVENQKMVFKRADALRSISEGLTWVQLTCEQQGLLKLFDNHIVAQHFFCRLLNAVFGLQLEEMDLVRANYPAIDLGDKVNGIAYQITTERRGEKMQSTLDQFVAYELHKQYSELKILVIGDRQSGYKALNIPSELSFTWEDDIIDIGGLLQVIGRLDTGPLERLADVVQAEIKGVSASFDLRLYVTAHNEAKTWRWGDETKMTYTAEEGDDIIVILPSLPYLERVKAGGPIEPLRYKTETGSAFQWDFPALDFKFQNRGSAALVMMEAVLDVEESVLDATPAIALRACAKTP
jgi:hypothetical protein